MNRLTKLLLAGTLVPALCLSTFAGVSAQAPEKHKAARGEKATHAESGTREGADKSGGTKTADAPAKGSDTAEPKTKGKHRDAAGADKSPDTKTGAAASDTAEPKSAAERKGKRRDAAGADKTPDAKDGKTDAAASDTTEPRGKGKRRDAAGKGMKGKDDAETPAAATRATPADPATPTNAMRAAPNQPGTSPNEPQNNNAMRAAPNGQRNDNDNAMRNGQPNNANAMRDNNNRDNGARGNNGMSPAGAAADGAAAGFAGGFIAATSANRIDEIRRDRREVVEDGRTYIREPGRTIVQDRDGRAFIVHDETERFRQLGYDVRRERRGSDFVEVINRPGGEQIVTYTDESGRMLRRVRRSRDGREVILIDNRVDGRLRPYDQDVVVLPPPPLRIPRERYVVDYRNANEGALYEALAAPPVAPPPQRYTLDQVRYSPDVRNYVRSVDINTINFDTGSWTVPAEATRKLEALANAVKRATQANPNSVFLIEGYTDAVGNDNDNLSLSDRRAQSVATILTKDFGVPPESLTTQGYGKQNLKEKTDGPSEVNRRVTVRNITQLLAQDKSAAADQ